MSQIMGLPAATVLKPHCKDMTVWEKGRWAGYKEAIGDAEKIIKDAVESYGMFFCPPWDGEDIDTVLSKIFKELAKLMEDETCT